MRFNRSAAKRQTNAQAYAQKLAQYNKKEKDHDAKMVKTFKAEKEKQDFLIGKSHEKYNSVLSRKKDLDQNYDLKMKDLARRIKMKESRGTELSQEALRLREKKSLQISGELDVRLDELESADDADDNQYNRDVTDPFAVTQGRNVNFEMSR